MGRKLYVGNIPYETGEAELQALFGAIGTVDSVRVMRDRRRRARGFAFVEMATDEEAQQAIAQLNDTQFEGRALAVNEARPKPAFAGGGGGGYDRGNGGGQRRRSDHAGNSTRAGSTAPLRSPGRGRLTSAAAIFFGACLSKNPGSSAAAKPSDTVEHYDLVSM